MRTATSSRVLAVAIAVAAVAVSLVGATSAQAASDTLAAGTHLTSGQSLNASNGTTRLVMQSDGNLVEYVDGIAIWYTSTRGAGNFAKLSTDGNLAVYNSANGLVWSANSGHPVGTYHLTMQADGNLVVYPAAGGAVWSNSRNFQYIAATLLAAHGWDTTQFNCLDNIYQRESSWKTDASNPPANTAWGIPQALPGSKMAIEGPLWRTDAATQLRWGINDYIAQPSVNAGGFSTPCTAWTFWQSHTPGWY